MKKLIELFVDRSLIVNTLMVTVCVLGFATFSQMSRDLIPTIQSKTIRIEGVLPGASAVDVERFLTFPIEEAIADLPDIKRIKSNTQAGEFVINVIFKPDHDGIAQSLETIRSRVDALLPRFPRDLQPLTIRQLQQDRVDFLDIVVEPIDERSAEDRLWVKSLAEQLDKVPHVIAVESSIPGQDLYIELDRTRIDAAGLDIRDIERRIREFLSYEPIGRVETDEDIIAVALDKGFDNLEALRKLPLTRNRIGKGLDLGDVAKVTLHSKVQRVKQRLDGHPFAQLELWKDTGSDIIELEARIRREIEDFNARAPKHLRARVLLSAGYLIERPLSVILTNGLAGLAIVGFILFLFLGFRVAAMAVAGLPFVYLGTFIVLDACGVQIHLISVIGLLLVLGILVDDAILVSERFLENVQLGLAPRAAAVEAAHRLLKPVSGTIITNIVVFAPILFIESELSTVFFAVPVVVIGTLLLSLFESFFILPNHLVHFVPPGYVFEERRFFVWLQGAYRRALRFVLRWRYLAVAVFISLFAFSIVLLQGMEKKMSLNLGTKHVFVHAVAKESQSLEDTLEQAAVLEAIAKTLPAEDVEYVQLQAGEAIAAGGHTVRGKKQVQLKIAASSMADDANALADKIESELKKRLVGVEGFDLVEVHQRRADESKDENIVTIYVAGGDTLSFEEIQEAIRTNVVAIDDVEQVYMNPNRFQPAWRFAPDAERLAIYELDMNALSHLMRTSFAPQELSRLRFLGEEITVYSHYGHDGDFEPAELGGLTIVTPKGIPVALDTLGTWRETRVLRDIRHVDLLRKFEIDVLYDKSKMNTDDIKRALDDRLSSLREQYPQYAITIEPPEEEQEAARWVTKMIIACLGIVFLTLVFVLGSLGQPLLVMFSIPFGMTGVVLALVTHGMPLGIMAAIGLIGLAGVVVNDSLVMVDTINQRDDRDRRIAIVEGATSRLKAVLLTSLTTLGGVFPLAYGIGGKAGFAQPMVFALGWGMLFATLLTLLLLPCTLLIMDDANRVRTFIGRRVRRVLRRA